MYTEKKYEPTQPQYHPYLKDFDPENSQCFFEIEIGKEGEEGFAMGTVIFEVFTKSVPKTAENFRQLCTGEKGELYHYKDSKFHLVADGQIIQGGDTTGDTGTGGLSIYGHKFDDELIWFPHSHKGVVSTANNGPNANGAQFFICMKENHAFNGNHTVFARVIQGFEILERAEKVPVEAESQRPLRDVRIVNSGELVQGEKL